MWRLKTEAILWLLILSAYPARSDAAVFVEDTFECISREDADERLNKILATHDGSDELTVTLVTSRSEAKIPVTLRVVTSRGDVILERRFELQRADCPSIPELAATALDRFLQSFPKSRWSKTEEPDPPPPDPIVVVRDVTAIGALAHLSVDSRWDPSSLDIELGGSLDIGSSRHRLVGSLATRWGLPRSVGTGHFIEGFALLGLGWRYASESWRLKAEARTGGLVVAGYDFSVNRTVWLPWLEFQGTMLWQWGSVLMGPNLGVSPLRHDVVTSAGASSQVPWLRLGITIALPIWTEKV